MHLTAGKIIRYIQQTLYEGREANQDGNFIYTRKELSEGAGISPTIFDNNRKK